MQHSRLISLTIIVSLLLTPMVQAQIFDNLDTLPDRIYNSGEFDTDMIIDASIDGIDDCLDYCFIGICIILVCSIYECHTEYAPRVQHNMPDLVVSVYPQPGEMSWTDAEGIAGESLYGAGAGIMGSLGAAIYGGGAGMQGESEHQIEETESERPQEESSLVYKEVSAIGNPLVDEWVTQMLHASIGYICPTETDAGNPYFLSEMDSIAWRTNVTELFYLASWNPFARQIGDGLKQKWGSVHPRHGFVIQNNDAKGGAVMAQRAVDIVTRSNQPHVYQELDGVPPSDENEERWQMLAPEPSSECIAFGKDMNFGKGDQNATDKKYGYLWWGTHKCCTNTYGLVIGYIEIDPICI